MFRFARLDFTVKPLTLKNIFLMVERGHDVSTTGHLTTKLLFAKKLLCPLSFFKSVLRN
jgi:hypothetical protein